MLKKLSFEICVERNAQTWIRSIISDNYINIFWHCSKGPCSSFCCCCHLFTFTQGPFYRGLAFCAYCMFCACSSFWTLWLEAVTSIITDQHIFVYIESVWVYHLHHWLLANDNDQTIDLCNRIERHLVKTPFYPVTDQLAILGWPYITLWPSVAFFVMTISAELILTKTATDSQRTNYLG